MAGALISLAAFAKAIKDKLARLDKLGLPSPQTDLAQAGDLFPTQTNFLFNSRDDLAQVLSSCAPPVGAIDPLEITTRARCFVQVAAGLVNQQRLLLSQFQSLRIAIAGAIAPPGTTGTEGELLRQAQIAYLAKLDQWIASIVGRLQVWDRTLAAAFKQVNADISLTQQIVAAKGTVDEAARQQLENDNTQSNIVALKRVYLPMVDLALIETKALTRANDISNQLVANNFQFARDNRIGWQQALEGWAETLSVWKIFTGSGGKGGGLLGTILRFFLGDNPGSTILTVLVIGGVVLAGIFVMPPLFRAWGKRIAAKEEAADEDRRAEREVRRRRRVSAPGTVV